MQIRYLTAFTRKHNIAGMLLLTGCKVNKMSSMQKGCSANMNLQDEAGFMCLTVAAANMQLP